MRVGIAALLLVAASVAPMAKAQASPEAEVKTLVQRFFAAEKAYDADALAKLVDPQYFEISPAGELDEHDRFLGFYAPEKKTAWPPMTVSEEKVRVFSDVAVETLKTSYEMPDGNGGTRTRAIRALFVAHRESTGWKLISAQYTGIRPAPSSGK
ncbi:nuclear transport factor 2 family protein [Terriglobus aquaticus]|uniref:Nuclear transport factor 2 family protein n=1 Tax=Terriglobus aquaticus TaxID=940139 RepID=A0ABW9KL24_9BACT|nr:nuclear transport factor 2 family protein [Terriglobus aquaticus]